MRKVPNGKGLARYVKWLQANRQAFDIIPGRIATVYSRPLLKNRELREGLKQPARTDCTVLSKSTTGKKSRKIHGFTLCKGLYPHENGRFEVSSKNLTVIKFRTRVEALQYIALMRLEFPKGNLKMRDKGPSFEHESILEYTF